MYHDQLSDCLQLRVEDMMKRSFSEWSTQKDAALNKATIIGNRRILSSLPELQCLTCVADLDRYHEACMRAESATRDIHASLFGSQVGCVAVQ
jgi:antiviral helicase SKI2